MYIYIQQLGWGMHKDLANQALFLTSHKKTDSMIVLHDS